MIDIEAIEAAAWAYANEQFKDNPNGFHIAPWVNAETLEDAFEAGAAYRDANQSEKVLALVQALESANRTLIYVQEEYAHGHGVNLIYETVKTNKQVLARLKGEA